MGSLILSGGERGSVKVWDLDGHLLRDIVNGSSTIWCVYPMPGSYPLNSSFLPNTHLVLFFPPSHPTDAILCGASSGGINSWKVHDPRDPRPVPTPNLPPVKQ